VGGMGPARQSGSAVWPVAALTGGTRVSIARPAVKKELARADRWSPAIVPDDGSLNTIQIQMNSNYFKTFQTLTDPKTAFPSLKNLK
jgi:hypothetical protein